MYKFLLIFLINTLSINCLQILNPMFINYPNVENINNFNSENIFLKGDFNDFNKNIGLIIFPGFGKEPESYLELSKSLQKKANANNINLNIIITKYLNNNLPFIMDKQTDLTLKFNKKLFNDYNLVNEKTFVLGHSSGGYFSIKSSEKYIDGLILMGATFNSAGKLNWKKNNLKKYSIPVLTLLGNKDGYLNYLNAIDEYDNLKNNSIDEFEKPIIIQNDVNHLQMADNVLSPFAKILKKKDQHSNLNLNQAHEIITKNINNFILSNLDNSKANSYIFNQIQESKNMLHDFTNLKKYNSQYSINAQKDIFNSDFISDEIINNTFHDNLNDFMKANPLINNNGQIKIHYFLGKNNFKFRYSSSLLLKLKSQESLKNNILFKKQKFDYSLTAKDINQKNINDYINKNNINLNINIVCLEDKIVNNEIKWYICDINEYYDKLTNTLYLSSPVFRNSYKEIYYLKILSKQQIYELLLIYNY